MLPMTFAELLNQPNLSIGDILPSMYATLLQVIVMTAVPSVLAGIVGAITGLKKVQMPQIDVAISR
jgi:hydrogenase/urease accessory protein HupE